MEIKKIIKLSIERMIHDSIDELRQKRNLSDIGSIEFIDNLTNLHQIRLALNVKKGEVLIDSNELDNISLKDINTLEEKLTNIISLYDRIKQI